MSFPSSLDTFTRPEVGQKLDNPSHVGVHGEIADSLEAIQQKLGVNGSSVITSIDYILKNVASVSPGHKHVISDIQNLQESLDDKIEDLTGFDTGDLAEGTNLYYTDARVQAALSSVAPILYDAGEFSFDFSHDFTGADQWTGDHDHIGNVSFLTAQEDYSEGTLATAAFSQNFTVSGGTFTSDMIGHFLQIDGDTQRYLIADLVSDSVLEGVFVYHGGATSGNDYSILRGKVWFDEAANTLRAENTSVHFDGITALGRDAVPGGLIGKTVLSVADTMELGFLDFAAIMEFEPTILGPGGGTAFLDVFRLTPNLGDGAILSMGTVNVLTSSANIDIPSGTIQNYNGVTIGAQVSGAVNITNANFFTAGAINGGTGTVGTFTKFNAPLSTRATTNWAAQFAGHSRIAAQNNSRTYWGQSNQAFITYDATDFVIEPKSVGSGILAIGLGSAAQTVGMKRNPTASTAGQNLTVQAGGAASGGTNLNGGDLILAGGIATGNGESGMQIHAVQPGQGSGTTTRTPSVTARVDWKKMTFEAGAVDPVLDWSTSGILALTTGSLRVDSDIEITGDTNGLILESPDNTRWRVKIDNSGVLQTTSL